MAIEDIHAAHRRQFSSANALLALEPFDPLAEAQHGAIAEPVTVFDLIDGRGEGRRRSPEQLGVLPSEEDRRLHAHAFAEGPLARVAVLADPAAVEVLDRLAVWARRPVDDHEPLDPLDVLGPQRRLLERK